MRIAALAVEAHLRLRRNKVFLPMLLVLLFIGFVASLAGNLVGQDYHRIVVDAGLFGMHAAGGLAAIFWGVKMLTDARTEGSLEVQLATPAARYEILIGKYLGLAVTLALLGGLFLALGAAYLAVKNGGTLSGEELVAAGGILMIWAVLGAVAVFFATFCNNAVAIFASLAVWLLGAFSTFFLDTGDATGMTTTAASRAVQSALRLWDLQRLNVADRINTSDFPGSIELVLRFAYGAGLVAATLSAAVIVFGARDVGET